MPDTADTSAPDRSGPSPEARRARVHELLLAWYAAEGRAQLPWRDTHDPYAILVSEVMLQQTQVERVLPKYREWMGRFPTLASLAEAPAAEAIKAWAGLGYNSRAVRLHQIARQAMDDYGGSLPDTVEGLLALKGIGRYTAGALACFAFGLPVATVDTNIRRVLWRVFRGIEPVPWPGGGTSSRVLLQLAEWALPPARAYDWQQALMDLGATVCLARRPLCERCPVAAACAALEETARVALFPSGEALARLRAARAAAVETVTAEPSKVAEPRALYATDGATPSQRPTKRQRTSALPFEQTTRYFRGRIVDALRALSPGEFLPLAALGPHLKPDFTDADLPWLRGLARGLERDGLARLSDDGERIALP